MTLASCAETAPTSACKPVDRKDQTKFNEVKIQGKNQDFQKGKKLTT